MEKSDLTVQDLHALGFEEKLAEVSTAVSEGRNVAVVSEPFAGRNAVLDYVETSNKDSKRRPAVKHEGNSDADVLIFDDCHRLYLREIDGFDCLDSFLNTMATSDAVFLTSWNEYSWRYLSETKGVTESFEAEVTVPSVGIEALSEWLRNLVDHDFEYVDDSEKIPAQFDASAITSISTLREQLRLLLFVTADDPDPQRTIFQAITRISGGNPGVAKRVWKDILDIAKREDEIRTSMLVESEVELPALDYDEAFALQVIVSNEGMSRNELKRLVGSNLNRTLRKFADRDVIALEERTVRIEPEALENVVAYLENRRMLW